MVSPVCFLVVAAVVTTPLVCLASRLPQTVKPEEYHLVIKPFVPGLNAPFPEERAFTFDGTVDIKIRSHQVTNEIVLHSLRLQFNLSQISLVAENGHIVPVNNYTTDPAEQFLRLSLGESLIPDNAFHLNIQYTGIILKNSTGLFASYYDQGGEPKYLLGTMGEPSFARSVLPCFDEPAMKAKFFVRVMHPTKTKALSNGLETSTTDLGAGWSLTEFMPTRPTSPYLFSIVVGDLHGVQTTTESGVQVRIWAWTGVPQSQLTLAMNVTGRLVEFYGQLFNMPYKEINEKIDLVAFPQFDFGGFECYGLIEYSYGAMVFDEHVETFVRAAGKVSTISHEMAHQWFGDTVTLAWWDDMFLNEGMATYWSSEAVNHLFPDTDYADSKRFRSLRGALIDDGRNPNSRPVIKPVPNPADDPFSLGDGIIYVKGASTIRMVRNVLGETAFLDGIKAYVQRFKFGNANHEDLWAVMTEAAHSHGIGDWCGHPLNVSVFMAAWTLERNFPVISVQSMGSNNWQLTWKPYQSSRVDSKSPLTQTNWNIPDIYRGDASNQTEMRWLTHDSTCSFVKSKTISGSSFHNVWEIENYGFNALVRVNYGSKMLGRLITQIRNHPMDFDVFTKGAILMDVEEFSRLSTLHLDATLSLANETSYTLWQFGLRVIEELDRMFLYRKENGYLRNYILQIAEPSYSRLSCPNADYNACKLQQRLESLICRYDSSLCPRQQYQKLFQQILHRCSNSTTGTSECSQTAPDIRENVYCVGIRHGSSKDSITMLIHYQNEFDSRVYFREESSRILRSVGCTQETRELVRLIELALDNNDQKYMVGFEENPVASMVMWGYLQYNPYRVLNNAQISRRYLAMMILKWNSYKRVFWLQEFTHSQHFNGEQKELLQGFINVVKEKAHAFARNGPRISQWLKTNFS